MNNETSGQQSGQDAGDRSATWSRGCGYSRRARRRRQRRDDLLVQFELMGGQYADWWTGGQPGEQPADASRIEELEATVATMSDTIRALADRVKVLERIVVDDEARIAREIDGLRGGGVQND